MRNETQLVEDMQAYAAAGRTYFPASVDEEPTLAALGMVWYRPTWVTFYPRPELGYWPQSGKLRLVLEPE